MAAAHYDKLEEDRKWIQEYGCVKIVEETTLRLVPTKQTSTGYELRMT